MPLSARHPFPSTENPVDLTIDTGGRLSLPTTADLSPHLTVRLQSAGRGLLATLSGALDAASTNALRDVLSSPSLEGVEQLYLDLHDVRMVDVEAMEEIDRLDAQIIRPSEALDRLRELIGEATRSLCTAA